MKYIRKDCGHMKFNELADMLYFTHDWKDDLVETDEVIKKVNSCFSYNVKILMTVYEKKYIINLWLDDILIMEDDEYSIDKDGIDEDVIYKNIINWKSKPTNRTYWTL
jgi:hypothetical protein